MMERGEAIFCKAFCGRDEGSALCGATQGGAALPGLAAAFLV